MGYNSTILILNDGVSEIQRDPERFVKEMVDGIGRCGHGVTPHGVAGRVDGQVNFDPGQSTVISVAHTDSVTILAVGGNHATVLGRIHNGGHHHTKNDQESLLRRLADQYGFRLVRKASKQAKA